ncbi:CHAT domain-containing protein [Mycena vulgaris]|nr:CHAT domain-containing protein [Mycena vulgaris]
MQTAVPFRMTALVQPMTHGFPDLPATVGELERIRLGSPREWLTSLGDISPANVDIALDHLRRSSIFHFCMHGIQDIDNPLNSSLILADGRMKVSEMTRNLTRHQMKLAFLSACQTAAGDENVADEAKNFGATLLWSGVQEVVSTMWPIADPDAPIIADAFYECLFRGSRAEGEPSVLPDLTRAAESLHFAVTRLRRAEPNISFRRWVPLIHYGM